MKVRFLLGHAYGVGGAVRTTLTLAGALAARGHDVEVVSLIRRWKRPTYAVAPGVRIRVLDQPEEYRRSRWWDPRRWLRLVGRQTLSRYPSRLILPGDKFAARTSLWTDVALRRFFRSLRGGVIIGTNPATNLMLPRLSPPGVVTVGTEHLNLATRSATSRPILQDGYRQLDALVTLTEGDAAQYQRFLGEGVRVAAIPNALPKLKPTQPAQLQRPVAIAAGRLKVQKGYDLLITAWVEVAAAHPEWQLHLYGQGPERRRLKDQIKNLGLTEQVRLKGFTSTLPKLLTQCSMFILSSRYEGFPMVLLEAMGSGVPVVAFDCPTGPAELVEDGVNGLLVPPQDVPALTAAIIRMIEDQSARRAMGAAALQTSSGYDRDAIAQHWERLFEELGVDTAGMAAQPSLPRDRSQSHDETSSAGFEMPTNGEDRSIAKVERR